MTPPIPHFVVTQMEGVPKGLSSPTRRTPNADSYHKASTPGSPVRRWGGMPSMDSMGSFQDGGGMRMRNMKRSASSSSLQDCLEAHTEVDRMALAAIRVVAGSSHPSLAKKLSDTLGVSLTKCMSFTSSLVSSYHVPACLPCRLHIR